MNDDKLLYLEKSIEERIKTSGLNDIEQLVSQAHTQLRLSNVLMNETFTDDEIWENVHELLSYSIRRLKSFYNE